MRLGLVARADNSGLGIQSWEFARHMNPDKVMVINLDFLANDAEHCNKRAFLDRYRGEVTVLNKVTPEPHEIEDFLDGLDLVFAPETFYTWDFVARANARGASARRTSWSL